jgi:hypothetical protein
LVNQALTEIKGNRLVDLDLDTSEGARLAQLHFQPTLDATLRAHPWNCALARATLALSATPPAFGYTAQFALPTDPLCLRVINTDDDVIPWKVEGRFILSDRSSLAIRFIGRVADLNALDAMTIDAFTFRLAHKLAYPLTGSRQVAADMWELYLAVVREARKVDAQEGTAEFFIADEWENARF